MIAHTIQTIVESGVADRVVVSTDDDEIASVARTAGAEVPFMRPADLADDHTPTAPVIAHAIEALADAGDTGFDFVLVVYPTAIAIRSEDLEAAKAELLSSNEALVMSVGRYPAPIERAWCRDESGHGQMLRPEWAMTRTQDLPDAFYDAGQFYLATADFWRAGGDIAGTRPLLHPLPRIRTVDIDCEDDLHLAQLLLESGRV